MGFAFIREGDTTSHGGRVLACSPENTDDGRPIALLGDKVSCPKCGEIYPIVGIKNLGVTFDGRSVASDGDTTAEPTSGPGRSIGSGKSVLSQASHDTPQRGRFQVIDDVTHQPLTGHPSLSLRRTVVSSRVRQTRTGSPTGSKATRLSPFRSISRGPKYDGIRPGIVARGDESLKPRRSAQAPPVCRRRTERSSAIPSANAGRSVSLQKPAACSASVASSSALTWRVQRRRWRRARRRNIVRSSRTT